MIKKERSFKNSEYQKSRVIRMLQTGNLDHAQKLLEESLNINKNDHQALNLLATVHAQKGNFDEAIDLMSRLIKLYPSEPNLYFNIARAYTQKEELQEGIRCYLKYLNLIPHDQEVLATVARIFYESGDYEKSVQFYEKALAINQTRVDLLNGLGLALTRIGRYNAAESIYNQALSIQPNDHIVLTNLGTALYDFLKENYETLDIEKKLGIEKKVSDCFQKVIKLKPNYTSAIINLGLLHSLFLGRVDTAIELFQRALELEPQNGGVYFSLSKIYERKGNLNKAFENLNRAIECGFDNDKCLTLMASILYQQGRVDEAISQLLLIRRPPEENEEVLIKKHFWLGKCYDRLKLPNEAINNFDIANSIVQNLARVKRIDENKFLQTIEVNKKVFTKQWVKRWKDTPPYKGRAPVFLLGFPRSGTTLLDQILNSHSEINVIEEKPLLPGVISFIRSNFGPYPESIVELNEDQIHLLRSKYFDLVNDFFYSDKKTEIIVDKFPLLLVHVGLIQRIFPNSKVILVQRHPYDVCLSNFMQDFNINSAMKNFLTLESTASAYIKVMDLWFEYERIFDIDLITVKYENVVENIEEESKKLIEFLGLDWEQNILNYHKFAIQRQFINTPSYQDVMQPIFKRAKFRWRSYRNYMKSVTPLLAPYAKAFGYSTEY